MLINLYKTIKENEISLEEFRNYLNVDQKHFIQKMEGTKEFNKKEMEIIHSFFPFYKMSWLLENQLKNIDYY